MKKLISYILLVSVSIAGFISCSDDNDRSGGGQDTRAITIQTGISTKAVDDVWDSGDAIGVTMYNDDYSMIVDGYNIQYTTGDAGTSAVFTAASSAETLYFPQDGSSIRLRAYYPWTAGIDMSMLFDGSVSDQNELPDIDLMTAEHTAGFSKEDTNVQMHFYHRLSKLIFNLSVEDTSISLEDCDLTIRGMYTNYIYNLATDQFISKTDEANIAVPLRTGESGDYRQAIVIPRDADEGIVFEFVAPNGNTYIAYMSDTLNLEGGNQYTFRINFTKNPITVSATIQPWIVNDPVDYDALVVSTPAGASSGVNVGDNMNVYLQDPDDSQYSLLRQFTYTSDSVWVPNTPVYWEDIDQDPAVFKASIIASEPLNNTQLPDILIAEELSVNRNTGADFVLSHATSQVLVRLESNTFLTPDLDNATITLPNYLTGGTEQLGDFVPGTGRVDVEVDRTNPAEGMALIQPQTIAGTDGLVTVTINGRAYTAYEANGFTYEPGNSYELVVTLNKEEVTVSVRVTDWRSVGPIDLNAVTIGTAVSGGINVLNGEQLEVYTGDATSRIFMNTYTYDSIPNVFISGTPPTYWESLSNPTTFYGVIKRADAYNSTQLDDYLLGPGVTVNASNGVHFELEHAAAQVAVVLTSDDGTFSQPELDAMNIVLPNYRTGATIDNGVFVPGDVNTTANITVEKNVGESGNSALALIQPQERTAGSVVVNVVSPANRTYTATSTQNIDFAANTTTVLTIDMSKTEITVSATVTDWQDGPRINMTASQITISGKVGDTEDFFQGKSIFVYRLDSLQSPWTFTYSQVGSDYEWTGPVRYWEDQPGLALNMTGVYSPQNTLPTLSGTTFPWYIASNQTEQANNYYDDYDLLMSRLVLSAPAYADFVFTHSTSKVRVHLLAGTGVTQAELDAATVRLNGFLLNGTANLTTGKLENPTNPSDVTPYKEPNEAHTYTALVMPQVRNNGETILSVVLPGYNNAFPGVLTESNLAFNAGQETVINVKINKTLIELSATLEPWTNGPTGNITID